MDKSFYFPENNVILYLFSHAQIYMMEQIQYFWLQFSLGLCTLLQSP